MKLDFSSALTGAARGVAGEETESLMATSGPESPARTDRLMEEVCERENLKEALRQVKGNKGSAGVDGITVNQLTDYLKQHWPVIREQLLSGTYEPKPVRRVEIPKPDGGIRKLGIPTVLDRFIPASGDAGAAAAVELDVLRPQLWFSTGAVSSSSGSSGAAIYRRRGYSWVVDLDLEKFLDMASYCPQIHEVLSNRFG
jgi:RNA-directed DNA polymerase